MPTISIPAFVRYVAITVALWLVLGVSIAQLSAGDGEQPRQHRRIWDAARISDRQAQQIYDELRSNMAAQYRKSGLANLANYQQWPRYNTVPFRSAAHGRRFLNTYANGIARAYGRFEKAGKLPVGSIIAKDSYAVTDTSEKLIGPLFVMEKMPAGFKYVTGDWRYSMIDADGRVVGITNGFQAEKVTFCIACHLAVERHDHLHFMPERVRVR